MNYWMIRCGSGSHKIDDFLEHDIISIGWSDLGKLDNNLNYDELKKQLKEIYFDWTNGALGQSAGQIWRFYHEFNVGDKIVTYDSSSRLYYIGEILSDYIYDESDKDYPHTRSVEWQDFGIDRDDLTSPTKNTLGSTLTIFELNESIYNEMIEAYPGYMSEEESEELARMIDQHEHAEEQQYLKTLKEDAIGKSMEFIKDMISTLAWDQLEHLTSGLFKAMGYKIRMTSRGSDLGHDILASPDGLGLTEPRIKIEVKKRTTSKIGAPEIRSFVGGLRTNEKGVFLCTGGFSKEARYESERANFALTLIDSDYFVDLILEYYELMDIETKSILPLKKIYWPISD